ncbi:MAG: YggT family protein [Actinobacteria bacterium]|nr:YggT family protein [Actinomycetota bacterium]
MLLNFSDLRLALLSVLDLLVYLVVIAVFARALLSWFVRDPRHPLMRLLMDVTEPILGPIRRVLPSTMGFDLSPVIALVVITLAWRFVLNLALS